MNYPPVSSEYTTVDCAQLEKYLKAGMWKLADIETRKLFYLACGMNPGDQQSIAINQIPCNDLLYINQLWVKYSKGKFGFSTQKPIWEAAVKKFYNKTEAWNAYGDRVGWRINHLLKQNYWKKQLELTYDLAKAPAGHLPHLGDRFGILTLEAFCHHLTQCSNPIVPEE